LELALWRIGQGTLKESRFQRWVQVYQPDIVDMVGFSTVISHATASCAIIAGMEAL
jgi:hypothetical protein